MHEFAGDVGETEVATLEAVGQPSVIEAEQMEQRGVEVIHVDFVFYDVKAEIVSLV